MKVLLYTDPNRTIGSHHLASGGVKAAISAPILAVAVAQISHQQASDRTYTGPDQSSIATARNATDDGAGCSPHTYIPLGRRTGAERAQDG